MSRVRSARVQRVAPGGRSCVTVERKIAMKIAVKRILDTVKEPMPSAGRNIAIETLARS